MSICVGPLESSRTCPGVQVRLLLEPLLDVLEVLRDASRVLAQLPASHLLQPRGQRTDRQRGRHRLQTSPNGLVSKSKCQSDGESFISEKAWSRAIFGHEDITHEL